MKSILTLLFATSLWLSSPTASASASDLDAAAETYVKLVLALGQHDGGYVDSYYGPTEWAEAAKAGPQEIAVIRAQVVALRDSLGENTSTDQTTRLRHHYLATQMTAVIGYADKLTKTGDRSFDAEARVLFDTQPPHRDFTEFDAVLARLDAMLPGDGALSDRVEAFRAQFVIPEDKLSAVMNTAIAACRARTIAHMDLLPGENFTLEFVNDKPWSGYNWYKGKAFSLIQINTDLPIYVSRAVDLGCHEGYPGHHTYNALLEANLVDNNGWVEFSIYPLFSPQAPISEGSANYGVLLAFPGDERTEYERDVLFPLAGIDPALAEAYEAFNALTAELSYAGNEVARLYLNGDIEREEAVALQQKYSASSEARARQRISFVETYGAYVINYNWGKDLVKAYVEAGEDQSHEARWQRFKTLLSSPRLPSSLDW